MNPTSNVDPDLEDAQDDGPGRAFPRRRSLPFRRRASPFEQVVEDHGATVLRVCRAMLGHTDADDAWSETFIAAMRAYPDLDEGANVAAWLTTIAHNKSVDRIRARQRSAVPVADTTHVAAGEARRTASSGPTTGSEVGPMDEDLADAIGMLAPKQRGAVVYHYLGGLPYAEVGRILGTSEAAARRSAADGIANLRARRSGGR